MLAARSDRMDEIDSALYTLTLTNVAMAVTSLVLGFMTDPGMSFQECVPICFLCGSFISVPSNIVRLWSSISWRCLGQQ